MKYEHEFKRRTTANVISIILLVVATLFVIFLSESYSALKISLLSMSLLFLLIHLAVVYYERLYICEDFFVVRSLHGVNVVYYDEVGRILIHKLTKKNIANSNTYSIEILNKKNESMCHFNPSLLIKDVNKKLFFSSIQTKNSLFYIERVFNRTIDKEKRNNVLFTLSLFSLIISLSGIGFLFII